MTDIDHLQVPTTVVEHTIDSLRQAGERNAEGVVLWLGRRANVVDVVEAYVPEYESEHDRFWIPRESMQVLLRHLSDTGTFLAAQVHSHPKLAFHSVADDQWAIVRHLGALSLVLPYFAMRTSVATFKSDLAAFALDEANRWIEVPAPEIAGVLRIV